MNIFDLKIKGDIHSLYLVDDSSSKIEEDFFEFLKNRGIFVENNGNIVREEYDSFTIDDSRKIQILHNEKENDEKKIFIIKVKYFTNDAQHALLKLFEDTNNQNHFFIFSDNVEQMLDTVLSRAILLKVKNNEDIENRGEIFLKNNKNKRLEEVAIIIKSHKGDENSASLRDDARSLVDSIEHYLHSQKNNFKDKDMVWKFSEIIKSRKYLATPGASVKMILEHLSIVL